ncbi:flocculation-associated PEP-CTERM protein PepA [Denitromonas iodatirespirans]|uniref:Flocculation-associated PEP-CTERM protein PepA n=1 Tax=Denitromonas iodatirespirans TaxID=2795389 RepID=A0A944DDT8_DENI1|nr:flocculation-associated PEP-CTERM protein PepA [Denitromonas iodatirespirans]MBT0963211.1 flocculation-associated PEP-CTERM protein PepA [Denitromonas iodatirespirans]
MTKLMSKTLAAAALAASLGFASTQASAAFLDFTVDEGSVPGAGANMFTADKLNGAYAEKITFDGLGGFSTTAYATMGQVLSNDGTTDISATTQLGTGVYKMYAIFSSSGNVAPSGPGFAFTGASGSFSLYIDPSNDTTFTLGADGTVLPTVTDAAADDYLIASTATLTSANGFLLTGVGGFFDLVFDDFLLTAAGSAYFVDPNPFHMRTNVDGDFDNFAVSGTQTVTGDVSAVFIPEPGSLALLGVAMAGLGASLRRRK